MPFKLKSLLRLLGFAVLAVSVAVMSADHVESPGVANDPGADIADVYLFLSPESPLTRMIGAITFGGRPAPASSITAFTCATDVLYAFNIDRANAAGAFDNAPDITIFARFSINAAGACILTLDNVPGSGASFSGAVTTGAVDTVFLSPTGLKAFAGYRNDPFFFDSQGFTALIASFAAAGRSGDVVAAFPGVANPAVRRDSFMGRNASAIVFEMDINVLAPAVGGVRPIIRVWATTARRFVS